ncbi:MAG: hypothetical protein GQ532_05135 [Methylomarinum sp.]|nr:hypothetical protein [Methylomarinum sp.]
MESVDLYLVNNGAALTLEQVGEISTADLFDVIVVENQANNGYFPGCLTGYTQSLTNGRQYDAMLVSNVDIEVADDFFSQLFLLNACYKQDPIIIAPSIVSLSENKDRNPKVKIRFSKKQMQKYLFLYRIPYLHSFYKKTFYRSKPSTATMANGTEIYAPHGSFIVFLSGEEYWRNMLEYPVFLFGEEIYIGEQASKHNISVKYHAELKVIDSDHASTGIENESFIRKHNLSAISYLYNRYWNI